MTTMTTGKKPATTMIRWGAVVVGAIIGLAVLILLTSLFVAIGGEADAVARNLHWYGLLCAAVALFVAGLLSGWFSGVRGATSGLFHGITTWGLILAASLAFSFPLAFGALEIFANPLPQVGTGPLWAAFLSVVVGLVLAAIGGLIGGAMTRPAEVSAPESAGMARYRVDDRVRTYTQGTSARVTREPEPSRGSRESKVAQERNRATARAQDERVRAGRRR